MVLKWLNVRYPNQEKINPNPKYFDMSQRYCSLLDITLNKCGKICSFSTQGKLCTTGNTWIMAWIWEKGSLQQHRHELMCMGSPLWTKVVSFLVINMQQQFSFRCSLKLCFHDHAHLFSLLFANVDKDQIAFYCVTFVQPLSLYKLSPVP